MKFHMDEKENYKKKIDKMKDDMNRRNKEIQKEREKKKKQWQEKSRLKSLDFFIKIWYNYYRKWKRETII